MATIIPQKTQVSQDSVRVTWSGIQLGDTCAVFFDLSEYDDRTLQITGAFGAATVALHGSTDGANFGVLNDGFGIALANLTTGRPRSIHEYVHALMPEVSGADVVTVLTVSVLAKRKRKRT